MQVALTAVPNLVNMQVARQFEHHSPTSPVRNPSFTLANNSQYNTGFESARSTLPRQVPVQPARIDTSGPARRRRTSKSTAESTGKRPASTPDTASSSQPDALGAMLSDKKRNKLGYHRTSVACVHCRRRKIRCLLAPDDPQSRCANCIRLKKECNFFPVDQQPPHEKRSRTGSKAEKSSASSSPPGFTSEAAPEVMDNNTTFSPYHTTAGNPQAYPIGADPGESTAFSPGISTAPLFTRTFDFNAQRQPWAQHPDHHNIPPHHTQQPQQHPQHYDSTYLPEGTRREYWHHQQHAESPMSPAYAYSSITPHDPSGIHDGNTSTNSGQHGVYSLPRTADAAQRSMSFSQVENLQHDNDGYHAQGTIMMQQHPQRRATATSDMPPPSLRNSGASSTGSVADVSPIMYPGVAAMPPSQASSLPYGWAPPTGMMHMSQGMLPEEQDGRGGYAEDEQPTMPYSNAPH